VNRSAVEAFMKYAKLIFLVVLAAIAFTVPVSVHASVGLTVTPGSQVANQGGQAIYTINLGFSDLTPGNTFSLGLSGLPSSASYSFSPSSGNVGLGVNSQLTIGLSQSGSSGPGGLYCPGTYSFTVTATENDVNGTMIDSGSGSGSLNVVQVGPALTATVTTDKSTYTIGDTVNIQMAVNRPAEGTLSITPPSGPPAVFNYVFAGPTYTLARSFAAQVTGRYIVNLQTDDFCSGSNSAVAYFDVSPNTYQISVSLSGLPPQISAGIQIDGQGSGTIAGSEIKSLSFPISSTHTVTVDQYVPGNTGARYFAAQNSWTVSSSGSHTFNYQGQYMFTVGTNPNGITQVSGGGWYNAGSTVQTGTATSTLPGSSGTQYAFQSWQLDGVAQTGNPISVTLDKPHTAIATYQTQYQLTITSPYGNPQGAGWYAAGSTATFSVSSPSGILIQQTFVQWQGDYVGTSTQGTIVMDGPKTVQATWSTSYTQLYIALGAIALIAVAIILVRKRRSDGGQTTKATPPPPPPQQTSTTPKPSEEGGGPVNCPSCGAENAAWQTYCINCGSQLTDKPRPTVSEVPVSSQSDPLAGENSESGFE